MKTETLEAKIDRAQRWVFKPLTKYPSLTLLYTVKNCLAKIEEMSILLITEKHCDALVGQIV